jgi:hypothetical protein
MMILLFWFGGLALVGYLWVRLGRSVREEFEHGYTGRCEQIGRYEGQHRLARGTHRPGRELVPA